ncbi:MAG: selenocysteine-specific translation elongation factor [bacterium]|nr:selenocysteine-specific translation elongation factor [bacterium]
MTTQGHIIIGTAGHIDHGKTSLVKLLTGVDTDRLKEEKERGITIELGFAPVTLPSGARLGLVDVPGHERFIKNMVAGATGIDMVLLVIAADEGVMPQTREHLDICQLLGVKIGVVALTKADMVDAEWLEMVTEDVRDYLSGSFLEGASIVPCSSVTRQGREDLLAAVDEAAARVSSRTSEGIFRLPVDRVFTMKGFGTVVTGTLISGAVSSGQDVVFLPGEKKARLRGMQVHGELVDKSSAGTRTALNLQGIDKDEIQRGQTAAVEGVLRSTLMLDAKITLLGSAPRPLKNRDRLRLHLFTSEVMTRVTILEGEVIEPGSEGLVQLRLEEPAIALPGDRFVVRSYSPMTTIGGGHIIDVLPRKHRRNRQPVIDLLLRLDQGSREERVLAFLTEAADNGLWAVDLALRNSMEASAMGSLLDQLAGEGKVVVAAAGEGTLVYSAGSFGQLQERFVRALEKFHESNPAKSGIGREELRMRVARQMPDRPYRNLLSALESRNKIALDGDNVRLVAHQATLSPDQEKVAAKVVKTLTANGVSAPFLTDLAEELKLPVPDLKAVMNLLAERGDLVRIKDDYFIIPQAHTGLMNGVEAWYASNTEMALADFRGIVNTTRKWMIPLLEYLDRTQVTMRKGDVRIKRGAVRREA